MSRERHPVPASASGRTLTSVRRALEGWRHARGRARRIPEALWQAAVEVAQEHGVSKTSRELGLDYYALESRLRSSSRPKASPAFVEVPWPAVGTATASECRLELEDGRGARLRVELTGSALADLESLARALWSVAR